MEGFPRISIVTPCFNSVRYIETTVKSVLEQDYPNLEYIVMDGGSTDGTVQILKNFAAQSLYKNRFRWTSERDNGQTDAINKGLALSRGDWFAFLNASDSYEPGVFSRMAPMFLQYRDKGVLYGNCHVVYGSACSDVQNTLIPPRKVTFEAMSKGNLVLGPSSFYNMAAIRKVGEFDDELDYWMDYDMYLRISKIMEFQYVDIFIASFRISGNQKSMSNLDDPKRYKRFQKEAYEVWLKNGGSYFSTLFLRRFSLFHKLYFLVNELNKSPHFEALKKVGILR